MRSSARSLVVFWEGEEDEEKAAQALRAIAIEAGQPRAGHFFCDLLFLAVIVFGIWVLPEQYCFFVLNARVVRKRKRSCVSLRWCVEKFHTFSTSTQSALLTLKK